MKNLYKNDTFRLWWPICDKENDLPNAFFSVSNVQNYFDYSIKKHETFINNSPIQNYVNKIENRITFKIKLG